MSWDAADSPERPRQRMLEAVAQAVETPRRNYEFGVEERESGLLIGNCRLSPTGRNAEATMGYVYRRDRWGRGYGTEVVIALLDFGFGQLGLHRISASAHVDNAASWRVMEKAGMRREGRLRDGLQMSSGWADVYLYAILASDARPAFR